MNTSETALEKVRELERTRLKAIRANDTEVMAQMLDDEFVYISSRGMIYDKRAYIDAVRNHELTYAGDLDLSESEHRIAGDVVILVGMMRGHARLGLEQDVFDHVNMRVWRSCETGWKMLAWQSTARS